MKRIGILEPTDLVGEELRQQLERRPELCQELRFFSVGEGAGTLTEFGGAAAVVSPFDRTLLQDLDLLFACEQHEGSEASWRQQLPEDLPTIVVAPRSDDYEGEVHHVAGVGTLRGGPRIVVSPDPGLVGLARLLAPLGHLQPRLCAATILRPVSLHSRAALDEVFEQARALLSLQGRPSGTIFEEQVAFNLLPTDPLADARNSAVLGQMFADVATISMHTLQASVFHGLAYSVYIRFADGSAARRTRETYAESDQVRLADDASSVGPIDAVSADEVVIGAVVEDVGEEPGIWVWAVMDNLTRGTTLNAIALAEELLAI